MKKNTFNSKLSVILACLTLVLSASFFSCDVFTVQLPWLAPVGAGGDGGGPFGEIPRGAGELAVLGDHLYAVDCNDSGRVWRSSDGLSWTEMDNTAGYYENEAERRVQGGLVSFSGRIWVIGGEDIDGGRAYNDVWAYDPDKGWEEVTDNAGFMPRNFHATVATDVVMMIIGGYGWDEATGAWTVLEDVWLTEDGVNWHEAVTTDGIGIYPFLPLRKHGAVIFGDITPRIYVYGGIGENDGDPRLDVFSTAVPQKAENVEIEWRSEEEESDPFPRRDFATASFNRKMWIIGGNECGGDPDVPWDEKDGTPSQDFWTSSFGASWKRQTPEGIDTEFNMDKTTTEAGIAVFDEKMWIISAASGLIYTSGGETFEKVF